MSEHDIVQIYVAIVRCVGVVTDIRIELYQVLPAGLPVSDV